MLNGKLIRPPEAKVCGKCVHFVRDEPTAQDLSPVSGQCRKDPPHLTLFPMQGPGGQVILQRFSDYTVVNITYPGCSHHQLIPASLSLE